MPAGDYGGDNDKVGYTTDYASMVVDIGVDTFAGQLIGSVRKQKVHSVESTCKTKPG